MQGEWIRQPRSKTAVIFVHGILSSGGKCWRHENGSYWPELLKNETQLESLGIYLFTYQTGIFSGSYRLGDIVDALKEHMRVDDVLKSDRIIFVCHSMGGIVVRKYLVERATDLIEGKKEIGLFLIASPSLGTDYANWLKPLARLFGNAQANALRFVQGNAWLQDLDKEFTNLKEADKLKIRGKELVEDKFVVLKKLCLKQLVEPYAGAKYFGEPFKVPESDHFSIAKPASSRSIQHRLLCDFIEKCISKPPIDKNPASTVLNRFATKIQELATHDDLVVPQNVHDELREIADEVANQLIVKHRNITSAAGQTGTQVLFHGARGTGKILAARVLAHDLRKDLYRINFGAVLGQHPVETVRHLHQLFEDVMLKNAILLVDDAEILFGLQPSAKMGITHNSPTIISSVLGALEMRGNLILTTTKKPDLDEGLLSLATHIVEFPFPDAIIREHIWQRSIPRGLEVVEFDPKTLGQQYKLCGEDIQNAVCTAIAIAKREGHVYVTMKHFESAAAKFLTQ